jgi:uncharacterized protein (DUF1499 family)
VSSDAPQDDSHHIDPLRCGSNPTHAWQALVDHLTDSPAYTIIERRDDYLRAEARTRLLRFVDDVEFHLRPAQGEIAMRSASRIGYSDFGANRRRLESLRHVLAQ